MDMAKSATPAVGASAKDRKASQIAKGNASVANPLLSDAISEPIADIVRRSNTLIALKGVDPQTHRKAQFYTCQFVNALSPTTSPQPIRSYSTRR
jgi:hypothetical protein